MTAFPTLGILTVTTGIMLTPDIGDVYQICGHVLNDPGVMTHQLPAASTAATISIFEQHPELTEVDVHSFDQSDPNFQVQFQQTCDSLEQMFGKTMDLEPATDPQWNAGRALQDLQEMLAGSGKPIVVVNVGDQEER